MLAIPRLLVDRASLSWASPQASLFHVIDLGDDMAFEELAGTATADVLSCNMEGVPTDESNLVIKVRGADGLPAVLLWGGAGTLALEQGGCAQ